MISATTRAWVIARLHERHLCVFRSAEVSATFMVGLKPRVIRSRPLIVLTTHKHGSACCYGNCQDDNDDRFHGFWHVPHSSAPFIFKRKNFFKKSLQRTCLFMRIPPSFETRDPSSNRLLR